MIVWFCDVCKKERSCAIRKGKGGVDTFGGDRDVRIRITVRTEYTATGWGLDDRDLCWECFADIFHAQEKIRDKEGNPSGGLK